jgi:DNA-directed RNA polymerase III subunit RPC4
MDIDAPDQGTSTIKRKVSFADDVKSPAPATSSTTPAGAAAEPPKKPKVDGIIGQLEVYRSGTVKMRLDNGIVLNVRPFLSPSSGLYRPILNQGF